MNYDVNRLILKRALNFYTGIVLEQSRLMIFGSATTIRRTGSCTTQGLILSSLRTVAVMITLLTITVPLRRDWHAFQLSSRRSQVCAFSNPEMYHTILSAGTAGYLEGAAVQLGLQLRVIKSDARSAEARATKRPDSHQMSRTSSG
jgi:hypothetical protein